MPSQDTKPPHFENSSLQTRFNDVVEAYQHSEAMATPIEPLPAHFKNAVLNDIDWLQLNSNAAITQSTKNTRQNIFHAILQRLFLRILRIQSQFNTATMNILFLIRPMLVHFADNDLKYYHSLQQLHEKLDFLLQENERLTETVKQLQAALPDPSP